MNRTPPPASILIVYKNSKQRIFISSDSVVCFACKRQGHVANLCPNLVVPTTSTPNTSMVNILVANSTEPTGQIEDIPRINTEKEIRQIPSSTESTLQTRINDENKQQPCRDLSNTHPPNITEPTTSSKPIESTEPKNKKEPATSKNPSADGTVKPTSEKIHVHNEQSNSKTAKRPASPNSPDYQNTGTYLIEYNDEIPVTQTLSVEISDTPPINTSQKTKKKQSSKKIKSENSTDNQNMSTHELFTLEEKLKVEMDKNPNKYVLSHEELEEFLDNAQGSNDQLSIARDYTPNVQQLLVSMNELYKFLELTKTKYRFTRLVTKIKQQIHDELEKNVPTLLQIDTDPKITNNDDNTMEH